QVDTVLLLSRVTCEGSRGAVFNPLVLPRLQDVCTLAKKAGVELDLQVAGSIKRQHIPQLLAAGTTAIAFGGALYSVPNMTSEVTEIRKLVQEKV
ncbi:MAG: hypothetical protein GXP38_07850, partial [Chloroflexi bacterium]|nr:hypothetical protein [Chloroflexota bacterium]